MLDRLSILVDSLLLDSEHSVLLVGLLLLLDAFTEPVVRRLASWRNSALDHLADFLSKKILHSDLVRATPHIGHAF